MSTPATSHPGDTDPERSGPGSFSRRMFLAGALGVGATALLAACGADDEPAPTSTSTPQPASTGTPLPDSAGSEWTFTDGRGKTVTLPKPPERIVAYSAAAASLWDFGVRPVGIFGPHDSSIGRVDLDQVESAGEDRSQVDIEKLVALKPDLIVSTMNTVDQLWGLQDEEVEARVNEVAPTIGMPTFFEPLDGLIGNFESLAAALGVDVESAEVAGARAGFERAGSDLQAALAEKPDLSVMVISPSADQLYFADPTMFADLIYFSDLGVNFIVPDAEPEGPWIGVSWEQTGLYPADLALSDVRAGWPDPVLEETPIWQEHPAAQAGQVGKWQPLFVLSYQGVTTILDELTAEIRACRDDVA